MKSSAISDAWGKCFPGLLPAGYLLRTAIPECWLRVHSLPGSKRYAESEAEYAEVLNRYYSTAGALLGEAEPCYLFTMRFGEDTSWGGSEPEGVFPPSMQHVISAQEDEECFQFFATEIVWEAQRHDALLRAVADDLTGSVTVFNPARSCAFAPYDGGADLFLPLNSEARFAKARFRDWLSARPDGQ